jgi:hypothetical protein
MSYLSMASLVQTAQIRPAQALPDETHQSWPIPVLVEGELRAAFLFAPRRLEPGKGQLLTPPSYLAQIDATTGTFLDLRLIRPAELGQSDDPGTLLGYYALPEGMDVQQYLILEAEALRLLDALLPRFVDDAARLEPALAKAAGELRARYWALTAAPLHPYYRAVGRRFFAWLDSVAA